MLESTGIVTVCITADRGDGTDIITLELDSINVTTQSMCAAYIATIYINNIIMLATTFVLMTYIEGVDHGLLPQSNITVSANLTRECVNITIRDDALPEENELFRISISSLTRIAGPSPYQIPIRSATVTIIDDECKS